MEEDGDDLELYIAERTKRNPEFPGLLREAEEAREGRSTDNGTVTSLALISDARRALAEARTLPDLRRVMEAASVATDAIRRQAALMEAQGIAGDIVAQANEAANDAASVRIEAQAQAGEMLRGMVKRGERLSPGQAGAEAANQASRREAKELPPSLADLGIPHVSANRWQKVADVPEEVRERYVETVKAGGGEVTTAGLIRYASQPTDAPGEDYIQRATQEVMRACRTLPKYDPRVIAGTLLNQKRRSESRRAVKELQEWLTQLSSYL